MFHGKYLQRYRHINVSVYSRKYILTIQESKTSKPDEYVFIYVRLFISLLYFLLTYFFELIWLWKLLRIVTKFEFLCKSWNYHSGSAIFLQDSTTKIPVASSNTALCLTFWTWQVEEVQFCKRFLFNGYIIPS